MGRETVWAAAQILTEREQTEILIIDFSVIQHSEAAGHTKQIKCHNSLSNQELL